MSVPSRTQLVLPETQKVAERIASLRLTGSPAPLKLGKSLDAYEKFDSTPTIGTEFAKGVQLSELLKAPNADEIIKDLAILSKLIPPSEYIVLSPAYPNSLSERRCLLPRSELGHRRTKVARVKAWGAFWEARIFKASCSGGVGRF